MNLNGHRGTAVVRIVIPRVGVGHVACGEFRRVLTERGWQGVLRTPELPFRCIEEDPVFVLDALETVLQRPSNGDFADVLDEHGPLHGFARLRLGRVRDGRVELDVRNGQKVEVPCGTSVVGGGFLDKGGGAEGIDDRHHLAGNPLEADHIVGINRRLPGGCGIALARNGDAEAAKHEVPPVVVRHFQTHGDLDGAVAVKSLDLTADGPRPVEGAVHHGHRWRAFVAQVHAWMHGEGEIVVLTLFL